MSFKNRERNRNRTIFSMFLLMCDTYCLADDYTILATKHGNLSIYENQ